MKTEARHRPLVPVELDSEKQAIYEKVLPKIRETLLEALDLDGRTAHTRRSARHFINSYLVLDQDLLFGEPGNVLDELTALAQWLDETEDDEERQQLELLTAEAERRYALEVERAVRDAALAPVAEHVEARLVGEQLIAAY